MGICNDINDIEDWSLTCIVISATPLQRSVLRGCHKILSLLCRGSGGAMRKELIHDKDLHSINGDAYGESIMITPNTNTI